MTIPLWLALSLAAVLLTLRFGPAVLAAASHVPNSITARLAALSGWAFARRLRTFALASVVCVALSFLALDLFLLTSWGGRPNTAALADFRPPQIGYFYDGKGLVAMRMATAYREPVTYQQIAPVMRQAIIAAEDKRFFSPFHRGIDLFAVPRVFWMNVTGQKRQGGSTVTQQLQRTTDLAPLVEEERKHDLDEKLGVDNVLTRGIARFRGIPWTNTAVRKTVEIKNALATERDLTAYYLKDEHPQGMWDRLTDGPYRRARRRAKEQILACYASMVYMGHGVYGFAYASQFYFGKPMSELRPDEAAMLASFIPFPADYGRLGGGRWDMTEKHRRRNTILDRMLRNGFITIAEHTKATAQRIALQNRPGLGKTTAPAAVNLAVLEVQAMGIGTAEIARGFAHPHMTLDLAIQETLNRAVDKGMANFKKRWPRAALPQVAAVVLANDDARILALYGGRYEDETNNYARYNRATQAIRQPGSTFKGIVALAAATEGISPDDVFLDAPISVSNGRGLGWHSIGNYDGEFKGPLPLWEIISQSRNAPTMRVALTLGIPKIIRTARALGITTELDRYPTTAIGAKGVIPLELANAYREIASGISATPYIVSTVNDEKGTVLVAHDPKTSPSEFTEGALLTTKTLLRGTVRLPKGTARSLDSSAFGIPVAGKTGTSNDHRDAWFVGFTHGPKGITVLAWVGYDDFGMSLPDDGPLAGRATGGAAALPIVREVFLGVYGENSPLGSPPRFPRELEERIDAYRAVAYPDPNAVK